VRFEHRHLEDHLRFSRIVFRSAFGGTRLDFDSFLYRSSLADDLKRMIERMGPRDRVLDLGCGKGHLAAYLASMGFSTRALDLSETVGEQLSLQNEKWQAPLWRKFEKRYKKLRYGFYSGQRIPFPKARFDAVLAYAVIEHVDSSQVESWLREIKRVLRPGGRLFIFKCPNSWAPFEHLGRFLNLDVHERLLTETELTGLLLSAGFRVEKLGRSDLFPAFPPVFLTGAWNVLGRFLYPLERLLLSTPLRAFSHHMWCVAVAGKAKNRGFFKEGAEKEVH